MSVVGIDIGNAFCVVAAAGKGGVDVVLNEESKRETPTCVAIGERQRFLGTAASSPTPGTTAVSQIKRLIGRPCCDPVLQSDLKTLFPNLPVSEDSQGFPLIHFRYRKGEVRLSPTQLLGMLLGGLKRSAERHLAAAISDCCIAVPAHFNDVQRRAVLHAAEIAGLRPLRLLHECSAAAIEYGIYRGDLPADPPTRPHVAAFVDVGHSSTQVAIGEFRSGEARILARAADPNLGGRDFDEALFKHFAAILKTENPDVDVSKSARASARLRTACEKVKKVLSANPEASLHIECFMDDKDASALITREEFQVICQPLFEKLRSPLEKALREAKLEPKDVQAVELIGSGSRVPAVVKVVADFFQQEPRRTLNASECVAKGCALQGAMLSPAFRVKKFKMRENVPFAIDVSWKEIIPRLPNGLVEIPRRGQILTKEDPFPTTTPFAINVNGNTFSFNLVYGGDSTENKFTPMISTCNVGPLGLTQSEWTHLIVEVKLNDHGIVSVNSLTMLLDKDQTSDPLVELHIKDDSRKLADGNPSLSHPMQVEQNTLKLTSEPGHGSRMPENEHANNSKAARTENTSLNSNKDEASNPLVESIVDGSGMQIDEEPSLSDSAQSEQDALKHASRFGHSSKAAKSEHTNNSKAVWPKSATLGDHLAISLSAEEKEIPVPFVEHIYGAFSIEDLKKAKKMEHDMVESDRQVEDAKDRKNALESYVYEMRNKLRGKFHEFVEEYDRQVLIEKLKQTETWLYEDGEDVECNAYVGKLCELKKLGDPIEVRFRESSEREAAVKLLKHWLFLVWDLAEGKGSEFAHIPKQEKRTIVQSCEDLQNWLHDRLARQASLHKWNDPVIAVGELKSKAERLERYYMARKPSSPPPKSSKHGWLPSLRRPQHKQLQEDDKDKILQTQYGARQQLDQERIRESHLQAQQQQHHEHLQHENEGESPQLPHASCQYQWLQRDQQYQERMQELHLHTQLQWQQQQQQLYQDQEKLQESQHHQQQFYPERMQELNLHTQQQQQGFQYEDERELPQPLHGYCQSQYQQQQQRLQEEGCKEITHPCSEPRQQPVSAPVAQDRGEEAESQQDRGKHIEYNHQAERPDDESSVAKYDEGSLQTHQGFQQEGGFPKTHSDTPHYMKTTQAAMSKKSPKQGHGHGSHRGGQKPQKQLQEACSQQFTPELGYVGSFMLGSIQYQGHPSMKQGYNGQVQSSHPVFTPTTGRHYNRQVQPQAQAQDQTLSGQLGTGRQAAYDDRSAQPPPPLDGHQSPGVEYMQLANQVVLDHEGYVELQRQGDGTGHVPPSQWQPAASGDPTMLQGQNVIAASTTAMPPSASARKPGPGKQKQK